MFYPLICKIGIRSFERVYAAFPDQALLCRERRRDLAGRTLPSVL